MPLPERCRAHRCPTPTNCRAQGYCAARGAPADEAQAQAWSKAAFDARLTAIEDRLFTPLFAAARERESA